MRFKLFGTEILVTFPFSAIVVVLLLTDRTGIAAYLIFAVLAHESAHLMAMWALNCSPKRVTLSPAAVEITSPPVTSPKEEAVIAATGPAANLLLSLTFWLNFYLFGSESALIFSLVNALIGTFNLLPVAGLDGGTLSCLLLTRFFGADKAKLILRIFGILLSAAGLACGAALLFGGSFNPTLFLAGLYILVMTLMKL